MAQDAVFTGLGWICLRAEEKALTKVSFEDTPCTPAPNAVTEQAKAELLAYLRGELRSFRTPAAPRGTDFQCRVWETLSRVGWGETLTYGELARRIGMPGGARAVAGALHRNPIPILIPCHRVVAAKGPGGYAFGLWRKQALLSLEQGKTEASAVQRTAVL